MVLVEVFGFPGPSTRQFTLLYSCPMRIPSSSVEISQCCRDSSDNLCSLRFTLFVRFLSFLSIFNILLETADVCATPMWRSTWSVFWASCSRRSVEHLNQNGLTNRKCKNLRIPAQNLALSVVSKFLCRIADLGCSSFLFHFTGLLVLWAIHPRASVTRQVFSAVHMKAWCHVALSSCCHVVWE